MPDFTRFDESWWDLLPRDSPPFMTFPGRPLRPLYLCPHVQVYFVECHPLFSDRYFRKIGRTSVLKRLGSIPRYAGASFSLTKRDSFLCDVAAPRPVFSAGRFLPHISRSKAVKRISRTAPSASSTNRVPGDSKIQMNLPSGKKTVFFMFISKCSTAYIVVM